MQLKLLVLDLDQTLVDCKSWWSYRMPNIKSKDLYLYRTDEVFTVFLRPNAAEFLQRLRAMPEIVVVLWSAGDQEYVYEVLDKLVLPAAGRDVYFDIICTRNNGQHKDVARLAEIYGTEKYLLVDDNARSYCYDEREWEEHFYEMPRFDVANGHSVANDVCLMDVFEHPFFDKIV